MPIWGRLKHELDRASRVAQGAIDEGRLRLEIFRARQRADRAAQTLGYAIHRARKNEGDLPSGDYERFAAEITRAEEEIARLERQLIDLRRPGPADVAASASPPAPTNPPPTP